MGDTLRVSAALLCLLMLGLGFAAGCGSEEDQTSPRVDTVAPTVPLDLSAVSSPDGAIELDWSPNTVDPDLAGYRVYRSNSATGGFRRLASGQITTNAFRDAQATPGKTYWYRVTARDVHENESAPSSSARVTAIE